MAKALEYPVVFKALLTGGHICESHRNNGRATKYTVHAHHPLCLGHITEQQFRQLIAKDVIRPIDGKAKKDKYGNLYYFYTLALPNTSIKEVQPELNEVGGEHNA